MKPLRKYAVAFALAAVAAVAAPSIASAHWVGRNVYANNLNYAIHYSLNPAYKGVAFFASYGGNNAVPYRVDIYDATTGVILSDTGAINPTFGTRYTLGTYNWYLRLGDLENGAAWNHELRCRIRPMWWPGTPLVGYYCKEAYSPSDTG